MVKYYNGIQKQNKKCTDICYEISAIHKSQFTKWASVFTLTRLENILEDDKDHKRNTTITMNSFFQPKASFNTDPIRSGYPNVDTITV